MRRRKIAGLTRHGCGFDPKVRLRFAGDADALRIPGGFSDVYLIEPSESLRQKFENEGYRMEAVDIGGKLWHLAK